MKSRSIKRLVASILIANIILAGIAALAFAGGGHDDKGKLEHVVSLEGKTGVNLLLAKWYNENRLLYALVVTFTMAIVGVIIGRAMEVLLRMIGVQ